MSKNFRRVSAELNLECFVLCGFFNAKKIADEQCQVKQIGIYVVDTVNFRA